jgi:hypothetical protein
MIRIFFGRAQKYTFYLFCVVVFGVGGGVALVVVVRLVVVVGAGGKYVGGGNGISGLS